VPLIAVAPNKFARGVENAETDWRTPGGRPTAYEVVELVDALEREYTTDAHLVSYIVRDAHGEPLAKQPRINKGGVAWVESQGFTVDQQVLLCDEDNPLHSTWTFEMLEKALAQYERLPVLATAGVYHTQHGRRFVQPLSRSIPAREVEPHLHRWLLELESAGIRFDKACRDWTRHFRLPNVRRDGALFRSPWMHLERMRPIDPPAFPPHVAQSVPTPNATRSTLPSVPSLEFASDLPDFWHEHAVRIGKAIREHVTERWHEMYLAVGGALLRRGAAPERLPAIVGAIAHAAGSSKPESHQASAEYTARAYRARLPCTGFATLRKDWPDVADALDDVTATGPEARVRAQAKEVVAVRSVAETVTDLEETLRKAPQGLTAISAECGLGKTAATIRIAAERAQRPYVSARATGARAPDQSKTAISVDKNELALQIADELRAKGVAVKRVFGPLSMRREDGTPECRYHAVAEPLVAGGQALKWILCEGRRREKCEFYETCKARRGFDGPARARVAVGPHALLRQLDSFAGMTGLLVIDEPPPFLETIAITKEDFHVTLREKVFFNGRYAAALTPLLQAVRGWVHEHATLELALPFTELVRVGANAIDAETRGYASRAIRRKPTGDVADDALSCAKDAYPPELAELGGTAPPLDGHGIMLAKRDVGYATRIGAASHVLGTLYRAATAETPVSGRVEVRDGERVLLLTLVRTAFDGALRRPGSVVVTDANAKVHLPILQKAVGYAPHFAEFAAEDGAPIERVLLRWRAATRKGWLMRGNVRMDAALVAVRAAIDWLREDHSTHVVGIITYKALREVLEGAANDSENFRTLCADQAIAHEHACELGALLRGWNLRFGHYGAVRGLNTMADVDAMITLGDPWPHVGEVRNEVSFLELDKLSEERLEQLCRAELEQAHGRIRAVHRKRPGRALHVGCVLPSGAGWASGSVETRKIGRGRPRNGPSAGLELLRVAVGNLGGAASASRLLGCTTRSLFRYLSGERSMPKEVVDRLMLCDPPA